MSEPPNNHSTRSTNQLAEACPVPPLQDIDSSLCAAAAAHPLQLALQDSVQTLTWQQLNTRLNQVANALIAEGIKPDERIAILARNSVDYATLFLGGLRAGICIVPLSTLASSAALAGMVNDSEAKLLFVSPDYFELIEPEIGQLTNLLPNGLKLLGHSAKDTRQEACPSSTILQTFTDFIAGSSAQDPNIDINLAWGFNLIYSSGTTGLPKGILQSRRYRAVEGQVIAGLSLGQQSRVLVSTPLYSNTTLFLFIATLSLGGSAYLMEKFNTKEFLKLSEEKRITHAVLVPVQYERLLNDPDFDETDLSSYQFKCSTSAPLHAPVKKALLERWPHGGLAEFYGMTEGGVHCTLLAHEHPDKLDTVGQQAEDCDLKIIDDQGNELPRGETGEVIGYSPRMMDGYHNRPDATEDARWYDSSGKCFQRSGDVGWLDEDNFLHLLDRKKDMIISGGFNVYAIDLERVLLSHSDIADVAVVAAPSEQWGETPVAFVVLESNASIDTGEIKQWANDQLGKAQRISEIRLIDELPRSPIGKILKRELRDLVTNTL